MSFNTPLLKAIGAVLSAVIIVVCGVIIFNATHDKPVNPQTFTGKMAIVSLEVEPGKPWTGSCKVTVRDEKRQELTLNTRHDVCGTSKPGDTLTMDRGNIVLGEVSGS